MAEIRSSEAHEVAHDTHAHPGPWKYVGIGIVLTVITAVEVAIFYVPALAGVLVPSLLLLSLVKFVLVVMFYMHLKFDSKVFTTVFVAPLTLAVGVVVSLIILFKVLNHYVAY